MDERAVGGTGELVPGLVDVLAEVRGGLGDLSVDAQADEVVALLGAERPVDEAEPQRRLLHPLHEVPLVEGEAQLAVLEHVVGARLVVSSSCRVHEIRWEGCRQAASAC